MTAYQVPRHVAWDVVGESTDSELTVFLMVLPNGPPLILRSTGALIWLTAADGVEDVLGEVAQLTSVDAAAIESEVSDFLESLIRDGLLAVAAP